MEKVVKLVGQRGDINGAYPVWFCCLTVPLCICPPQWTVRCPPGASGLPAAGTVAAAAGPGTGRSRKRLWAGAASAPALVSRSHATMAFVQVLCQKTLQSKKHVLHTLCSRLGQFCQSSKAKLEPLGL